MKRISVLTLCTICFSYLTLGAITRAPAATNPGESAGLSEPYPGIGMRYVLTQCNTVIIVDALVVSRDGLHVSCDALQFVL